ncbi:MAG: threonine--tRNA ligase, partial [Candidatus Aenigmarchaeota archaeon]|nr:threonine--tRNA ligase [bacterium]NIO21225.1 threonine--tRNA ligase [Candidatus Aenigmarchaeota archaeon]
WLAPTQVRVIPVSDKHIKEAEKIADKIGKRFIRIDLDDRSITMRKKVREAETQWVNYVLVIGEREVTSGIL